MSNPTSSGHGWHLSRTINITHLLTTGMLIISGLWYLAGQDSRIGALEITVKHMQESRLQDQARTEKRFDEIRSTMQRIDGKLDQLIRDQNRG